MSKWNWLPMQMPRVAVLIAERRQQHGAEWVAQCWQRGVVAGEPGWFFAAEGSLTLGRPVNGEVVLGYYEQLQRFPGAVLLDMRVPERVAA
jgi:hypothetical protein